MAHLHPLLRKRLLKILLAASRQGAAAAPPLGPPAFGSLPPVAGGLNRDRHSHRAPPTAAATRGMQLLPSRRVVGRPLVGVVVLPGVRAASEGGGRRRRLSRRKTRGWSSTSSRPEGGGRRGWRRGRRARLPPSLPRRRQGFLLPTAGARGQRRMGSAAPRAAVGASPTRRGTPGGGVTGLRRALLPVVVVAVLPLEVAGREVQYQPQCH